MEIEDQFNIINYFLIDYSFKDSDSDDFFNSERATILDYKFYMPNYTLQCSGMVLVDDDPKLTTTQFMDQIKVNPYQYSNFCCCLYNCPNINFISISTRVQKLCINYCHLKCIDGLSKMSLKELDLSWNDLTDISELKYLKSDLTELRLNNNNIIDISPLGLNPKTRQLNFKLNYLDLSFNQIINIDALKYQYSLESLLLFNNFIHDFSPIENRKIELNFDEEQQELNAVQVNYQNNYQTIIKVNILHNKVKQQKKHIFRIIYKTSTCKNLLQAKQNHQYFIEQAVSIVKQTYQDNQMCYQ
ncbi:chitobiase/beta-hexosaminidase_C-terminal domain-containing protein [Hexamita inflata]|uniref:Chitobiase/beta-hexosaminidase C-terminal domain-containing protein n=1 Tax=Hexamita inflata TaxID=28002 RepID=A0AA86THJ0_9EUKA|nr:chitobiase/beta-hexosaminidase C-terminal domain-containing protein [Hexamita inflata]